MIVVKLAHKFNILKKNINLDTFVLMFFSPHLIYRGNFNTCTMFSSVILPLSTAELASAVLKGNLALEITALVSFPTVMVPEDKHILHCLAFFVVAAETVDFK